ncbi:hypothetical protein HPP92_019624 [Vanilla planifolia]|uniref:Remorin C-terminal domain-containing protein n=1 Tax=Vanilla planifolia TaxID=51239 RepID=A0A835UK07_VANPL|nr:hypothetical protein HPP92_019624 [Vanilla planifolia]
MSREETVISAVTDDASTEIRDIHALTPSPVSVRGRARDSWEVGSHRSSALSVGSEVENFSSMSREFSAMVVAGSNLQPDSAAADGGGILSRIGEDELEETNPLAIVPDNTHPFPSPRPPSTSATSSAPAAIEEVSVHRVKKDEVDAKIAAWQAAEIAKINNRFKREDVTINGWESEQLEKATAWLKKIEASTHLALHNTQFRNFFLSIISLQTTPDSNFWLLQRKLEEKRARAVEKTQNEVARAHRKAEDKRASAESKRGVKVARVHEVANLLRAVGRAPSKRSFF